MSNSYIGVTGFTERSQIEVAMRSLYADQERKLMAGVLVSDKTLKGEKDKLYPNRYPSVDSLGNIFIKHQQLFNVIHFHSSDKYDWCDQLMRAVLFAGEDLCDGVQLNMTWADPGEIENFKRFYSDKKIILSVNQGMLKAAPNELLHRFLIDYDGIVDYVLFDASGGSGTELDSDFIGPYIKEFKFVTDKVNLAVAGGLWSNNLRKLDPLLKIYPDLSIDAEGMLRDKYDDLSMIKARNYLNEAIAMIE